MSSREFAGWVAYYKACPFDDKHRYHRPAALVAAKAGNVIDVSVAIQDYLDWLAPDPELQSFTSADVTTLRAFGIRPGV